MRYGEMKTSFMSVMENLKIPATVFDFGESLDAGIYFIALNLPSDSISHLIKVVTSDINIYVPRQITLPGDYMRVESVRLAKERVVLNTTGPVLGGPIFLPTTIVSQREFLNRSQYSNDPVVSFFNGLLNYSPDLPAPLDNFSGPIELTYRRIPDGYIRKYTNRSNGVVVGNLKQDPGNNQLFDMSVDDDTWEDLGLSTDSLKGGSISFNVGSYIYSASIDYAWDDVGGTFSGLHVKEDTPIPALASGSLLLSHVSESPLPLTGGQTYFNSDSGKPDLPESFHRLVLDYAIGKFLMSRRPDVASGFMNLVMQTFAALGVNSKIEFGGEEA